MIVKTRFLPQKSEALPKSGAPKNIPKGKAPLKVPYKMLRIIMLYLGGRRKDSLESMNVENRGKTIANPKLSRKYIR